MLQHLGLVTIVLTWLSIFALLKIHGPDRTRAVSGHAAYNAMYHFRFGVVEIFIATLLWIFIHYWYVDNFDLPVIYDVLAGLSCLSLVVAAIIPQTTGWRFVVHELGAYTMALGVLIMTIVFLVSVPMNVYLQLMFVLSSIYMAAIWVIGGCVA